jgi:hypothetical protein
MVGGELFASSNGGAILHTWQMSADWSNWKDLGIDQGGFTTFAVDANADGPWRPSARHRRPRPAAGLAAHPGR